MGKNTTSDGNIVESDIVSGDKNHLQSIDPGVGNVGRDDQRQYTQRTEQREYDQRADNRRHDQRSDARSYDQREDARGGNVTFQSNDNQIIWQELREVTKEIEAVRFALDDLPNRVKVLEIAEVKVASPVVAVVPLVPKVSEALLLYVLSAAGLVASGVLLAYWF